MAGTGRAAALRLPDYQRLPGGGHSPDQVQIQDEGVLSGRRHPHRPLPHGGRPERVQSLYQGGGLARGGKARQRSGGLRHPQAVLPPGAEGLPGRQKPRGQLHHGGVRLRRGQLLRRYHRLPGQSHL